MGVRVPPFAPILLLLLTCFTAPSFADAPPQPPEPVRRLCDRIATAGSPREQFLASLGPIRGRTAKPRRNPHEASERDTVTTLDFAAARVVLFERPGGEPQLVELTLRRNLPQLAAHLGDDPSKLVAELGPPRRRDASSYAYDCSYELGATLTFALRGGKVASLQWSHWPD